MISAILFDLDGVLVRTDKLHFAAWKKLTDRLGIFFDQTVQNRISGMSRTDSLEIILQRSPVKYDEAQKRAFAEEKNDAYKTLLSSMSPDDVSDEVRRTLSVLKQSGFKLAVASSSKNARYILDKTQLTQFFRSVTDGNEISRGKPSPEVFLNAARKLNVSPSGCIVVEDAEAGIEAALSAGMTAAAIGRATVCGKAQYALSSFSDILTVVQSANA